MTLIERAGERVGALVHDSALREESGLLDAVCAAAGLAMENERLHAEVLARLPVEAAVYYVVSEALANVAKYANASSVTVTVGQCERGLGVEVADDGVGGATARQGSGLEGLADRVAARDGRLVVESSPGNGTRVTAEMPCG